MDSLSLQVSYYSFSFFVCLFLFLFVCLFFIYLFIFGVHIVLSRNVFMFMNVMLASLLDPNCLFCELAEASGEHFQA